MSRLSTLLSKLWPTNPGKQKTQLGVAIIVLLLLIALATQCAKAAEPYAQLGVGWAPTRGQTGSLDLAIRWPDAGPGDADFAVGTTFVGPSSADGVDSPPQFMWRAEVIDGLGRLEVGLGMAYIRVTDYYNCGGANFSLRLGWKWTSWLSTNILHYSNGGTCRPNKGRDLLYPLAISRRW